MAIIDQKESIRDILTLLRLRLAENSGSIALEPVGRAPVSYRALVDQIERNAAQLTAIAKGRRPRIGIVMPNGADMAVTLLSVCCAGAAIPLNPGYREAEFEDYFRETRIEALIVPVDDKRVR